MLANFCNAAMPCSRPFVGRVACLDDRGVNMSEHRKYKLNRLTKTIKTEKIKDINRFGKEVAY